MPNSVVQYILGEDILNRAIQKAIEPEIRMVRRGKFFLSEYEMARYGSLRRPIFQYYGHNVFVANQVDDSENMGVWCYGSHNDFNLIPDTIDPLEWPEYERTETGWSPRITKIGEAAKPSIDLLKFDWSKALGVNK